MFFYKIISIFAFICIMFSLESTAGKCSRRREPCLISFLCSTSEDVVWATDGRKCYVFRNDCYLKNENCNRQNKNLKDLKKVSKIECQKLCQNFCLEIYSPVCGIYIDAKRTFSNLCEMENYICESGETYELYSNTTCEAEPTVVPL